MTYLDSNSKLAEEQNGFRKEQSCIDHIHSLYCISKDRQKKGLRIFLTFIDFSKAFDCLDRQMLMHKLLQAGVKGSFYFAIKALYMGKTRQLFVPNTLFFVY